MTLRPALGRPGRERRRVSMATPPPILFNGFTADQLLAMPVGRFDAAVLNGSPVVIDIGTSNLLAKLSTYEDTLLLELGHIDGDIYDKIVPVSVEGSGSH